MIANATAMDGLGNFRQVCFKFEIDLVIIAFANYYHGRDLRALLLVRLFHQ